MTPLLWMRIKYCHIHIIYRSTWCCVKYWRVSTKDHLMRGHLNQIHLNMSKSCPKLPGKWVGHGMVLHVFLVSGFSSSGHRVLGCWFSSIHLISLVLNPVSHDFEHWNCWKKLILNHFEGMHCTVSYGLTYLMHKFCKLPWTLGYVYEIIEYSKWQQCYLGPIRHIPLWSARLFLALSTCIWFLLLQTVFLSYYGHSSPQFLHAYYVSFDVSESAHYWALK